MKTALATAAVAAAMFTATGPADAAAPGCTPPSPAKAWNGDPLAPQVFGPRSSSLRTLFFLPIHASWTGSGTAVFVGLAGRNVKIVWGMLGSGRFTVVAHGPDGETLKPDWGPQPHSGGNWAHPGGEWGTGFVFPTSGCWRIHATHGRRAADIWLRLQQ